MRLKRLCPSCSDSCGTVCDSNFWLDLNYLEVARAAQSCLAHFTALLYTEIYVDKIKANMEESCKYAPRVNFFTFVTTSCVQFKNTLTVYFQLLVLIFLWNKCAELNPEQHARWILRRTARTFLSPVWLRRVWKTPTSVCRCGLILDLFWLFLNHLNESCWGFVSPADLWCFYFRG